MGTRLQPDEAYRFAKGEAIQIAGTTPARLAKPLDFVVIADHGNNLGAAISRERFRTEPQFQDSLIGKMWLAAHNLLKNGQVDALALEAGDLLPAHRSWNISVRHPGFRKTIWQQVGADADRFDYPGKFTTFIGYEWTPSSEEGSAEHRVVLFADDRNKTDQVLPFTSYDSAQEEDLWAFLDRYESATGGRVIAIPHNGNLTSGAMFALKDSYGQPLSESYAQMRSRFEPLVEVTQIKGDSETHPYLSPDDQFADFETWDGWSGWPKDKNVSPARAAMLPHEYARSALNLGLSQQSELGINPFKFGMIGSTDTHTGLATADDDNFWGKGPQAHPSATRIYNKNAAYNWQMNAAGYAAVWAKDNTRAAIFNAMVRKETYASTGPRIVVRFFGGFDFSAADARSPDFVRIGYSGGVPMGGDLPEALNDKSPVFLISAVKDPQGANLDRIQVIKGWRNKRGELNEKVYDVAWSGSRLQEDGNSIADVGSSVDPKSATYTNTIGSVELSVAWEDPDFRREDAAFYYVRVLQIPTPRWSSYDIARYGLTDLPAQIPRETQERVYTSPIWYTPPNT
jgi:hypothetical protein